MIYTLLVLVFAAVLGINFNKWYIIYAKRHIEKIKTNNPNTNENELVNICRQKGGTNIWLAIVIYVVFCIISSVLNPKSQLYNNNENLENYKGTWYVNKNNDSNLSIENDELTIKSIKDNTIIFDYTLSGLCGEKNITVKINNKVGKFKSLESSGTISFKNDKIILSVKNIHYNETFERTFIISNNNQNSSQNEDNSNKKNTIFL